MTEKLIDIAGRVMEDATTLKTRLNVSEQWLHDQIYSEISNFPKPIRIGRGRWFERKRIDDWLLSQTYQKIHTSTGMRGSLVEDD